ncbi:hypothetical protein [Pseudomonas sp. UV AK001]|uniref:hypothetical protein n=1 Tax=Pseudomonas sp. UV AK001 TaxID=3384791 RepID=UPI0038D36490
MSVKFLLRSQTMGPQVVVEIDAARHEDILCARQTLIDAKNFEERYEMIIGNYVALERFFADYALTSRIHTVYSYHSASAIFMEANRLVMNLLTTFKSYLDQSPRSFKHLSIDFKDVFTKATRKTFSECIAYRFISSIRNHVQHAAPPIHLITGTDLRKPWIDQGEFFCKKEILAQDKDFKKEVLDEIGDQVDLKVAFRQFMESLSSLHAGVRHTLRDSVNRGRDTFECAIDEYLNAQPDGRSAIGLALFKEVEGGLFLSTPVFLDWDETRIELASKNRPFWVQVTSPTAC